MNIDIALLRINCLLCLGDFGKISSSRMSSKGRNQSSKNIRRSVSRASSSRSNLHSNVNLTNINSNYPLNNTNIIEENHLEIYLRVSGYDPRKEIKPLPVGALTVGGLPPSRHLIRYSPNPDDKSNNSRVSQATEMVDISSNEVHFGVIPQYGVSRKMLIITNTSQDGHEVEYYINPDECSLYGEGNYMHDTPAPTFHSPLSFTGPSQYSLWGVSFVPPKCTLLIVPAHGNRHIELSDRFCTKLVTYLLSFCRCFIY